MCKTIMEGEHKIWQGELIVLDCQSDNSTGQSNVYVIIMLLWFKNALCSIN